MTVKATGISEKQKSDVSESQYAEKEPEVKKEYLEKLKDIRKGKFVKIKGSLLDRF